MKRLAKRATGKMTPSDTGTLTVMVTERNNGTANE